MLTIPFLLLAATGCTTYEGHASWMTGASYEWVGFNHRLAHWTAEVDNDSVTMAVIGGTSTTGQKPDLGETCDPDTCTEFPFLDSAVSKVAWGVVNDGEARFARGEASFQVDLEGGSSEATITFEPKASPFAAEGEAHFVFAGISIDGGVPFEEAACYNPSFGWLPVHLGIAIGEASQDGDTFKFPVTAAFRAGETKEEVRECLDAVLDEARATVTVQVLGILGDGAHEEHDVDWTLAYPWNGNSSKPDEQPRPQDADRSVDIGIADPLVGWSALDFTFHNDDPRGAYLRSVEFLADADGLATGHATNYSPITQLSAFDYHFTGTVVALEVGGTLETGTVTQTIPAELDDDGKAERFEFPLTK